MRVAGQILGLTKACLQSSRDSAACRLALVLVLLSMLGFSWAVENPASSVLLLHPWLRWAIDTIKGVGGKVSSPKSISHFPLKRV